MLYVTVARTSQDGTIRFGDYSTEHLATLAEMADEKLEDWILYVLRRPGTHYVSVGDTVRYDYPGEERYIEGVVTRIGRFDEFPDCPRYRIEVNRHVLNDEELSSYPHEVFPPMNWMPSLTGKTKQVVVIKPKV